MIVNTINAVKPKCGDCRFSFACCDSSPKEGEDDGSPKPRKSNPAKVEIAPVTIKGKNVSVATIAFGKIWRIIIIQSLTPRASAARTYSKLRALKNSARIKPVSAGHPNIIERVAKSQKLLPKIAVKMIITYRDGQALKNSRKR